MKLDTESPIGLTNLYGRRGEEAGGTSIRKGLRVCESMCEVGRLEDI
jgi:hypothetical protein